MAPKKKAAGDPANGEKVFKSLCSVCHSLAANSVGPALGAVTGFAIASQEGFQYSAALSAKATLKWSDTNLDKWLQNPASFAPGNAMAFAGIGSEKDRSDLIAYLKAEHAVDSPSTKKEIIRDSDLYK